MILEDSYPQPRTRVSAEPPPPVNVVSVVVMCVYLVCFEVFATALTSFGCCRGVCVGLCGVFCVCGGFVLFVCCVALCVLFRRWLVGVWVLLFRFREQASVASAVAQLSVARAGVVVGWGVVFVEVFERGGG
jgi:hypothetical protein